MAGTYKDLVVYQKAFELALVIFRLTENFDKREKYALTDQIRRSSRSVCSNVVEAYRKRQYESYFINKISDADMENSETQVLLDFALAFSYLDQETYQSLFERSEEIGRLLNHMMKNPERYRGSMHLRK